MKRKNWNKDKMNQCLKDQIFLRKQLKEILELKEHKPNMETLNKMSQKSKNKNKNPNNNNHWDNKIAKLTVEEKEIT